MAGNETIADIIAEMRQGMNPNGTAECQYLEPDICMLADRLEAALKREIDEAERRANREAIKNVSETLAKVGPLYDAESIGDCAKLREALVKAEAVLDGIRMMVLQGQEYDIHLLDIEGSLKKCRAALSAPPRNCDRPECATTKAAQEVWRRENGGRTAYHEWLFAPATEQEGGAK